MRLGACSRPTSFSAASESFHEQWLSLDKLAGTSKDPTLFPEFTATLKSAMSQNLAVRRTDSFTQGTARLSDSLRLQKLVRERRSRQGLWCVGRHRFRLSQSRARSDRARGHPDPGFVPNDDLQSGLDQSSASGPYALHQFSLQPHPGCPSRRCRSIQTRRDPVDAQKFQHARDHERLQGVSFDSKSARLRIRELRRGSGRFFRTQEGTSTVDASGALTTSAGSRPFANAVELGSLLATDPDAQSCVTRKWFRFALARIETSGDDTRSPPRFNDSRNPASICAFSCERQPRAEPFASEPPKKERC